MKYSYEKIPYYTTLLYYSISFKKKKMPSTVQKLVIYIYMCVCVTCEY